MLLLLFLALLSPFLLGGLDRLRSHGIRHRIRFIVSISKEQKQACLHTQAEMHTYLHEHCMQGLRGLVGRKGQDRPDADPEIQLDKPLSTVPQHVARPP